MKEIISFFKKCPALSGRNLREDYLGPESGNVAIAPDGGEHIIKTYTSGDSLGQICFKMLIRDNYTGAANSFYEEVLTWLDGLKELPNYRDRQAQFIEIIERPVLVKSDVNAAIYEMKLRLVYYRKGEIL